MARRNEVEDEDGTGLSRREVADVSKGVPLLRGLAKNGVRLGTGLRVPLREISRRLDHADTLEAWCAENEEGGRLAPALRDSAIVGLSLLRRHIEEHGERGRRLVDEDEADIIRSRVGQLDKLGKKLGAQLLLVDEDEGKEKPKKRGAKPAADELNFDEED